VMFHDLCAVTTADTTLFIAMCGLVGIGLGVSVAILARRWLREHLAKVGCAVLPIAAFAAGYLVPFLFPDPRENGAIRGATPDVIFYPGLAFCVVPVAMIGAFAASDIILKKNRNS